MDTDTQRVKIVGKYQLKKSFNSADEFNKYYIKHKEEIDTKTSNQLNKEYIINGYKITKRNIKIIDGKKHGEIFLKPIESSQSTSVLSENTESALSFTKLNNEIEDIKAKINILTESIDHIIDVISYGADSFAVNNSFSAQATISSQQN